MLRTSVTLSYGERLYTIAPESETQLKGWLSCDCMKSELIREKCDPEFPSLHCGNEIVVVAVAHVEAGAAYTMREQRRPPDGSVTRTPG